MMVCFLEEFCELDLDSWLVAFIPCCRTIPVRIHVGFGFNISYLEIPSRVMREVGLQEVRKTGQHRKIKMMRKQLPPVSQ